MKLVISVTGSVFAASSVNTGALVSTSNIVVDETVGSSSGFPATSFIIVGSIRTVIGASEFTGGVTVTLYIVRKPVTDTVPPPPIIAKPDDTPVTSSLKVRSNTIGSLFFLAFGVSHPLVSVGGSVSTIWAAFAGTASCVIVALTAGVPLCINAPPDVSKLSAAMRAPSVESSVSATVASNIICVVPEPDLYTAFAVTPVNTILGLVGAASSSGVTVTASLKVTTTVIFSSTA